MKDYDTIFVGYPIRWYVAPTTILFATTGGSGIGKTNERLAPSCKGAKLVNGRAFKGSAGQRELAAWGEGLGL